MTKWQYEHLKQYETNMIWATVDNVTKSCGSNEITQINSIYTSITGDDQYRTKLNCPTCVLKLWKKLHQLYNEYAEELVVLSETIEEPIIKNKPGRPKTIK